MTAKDRAYHGAHEDERSRVNALRKHEAKVRDMERARVKRNLLSLLNDPDPTEIDWFGCTT